MASPGNVTSTRSLVKEAKKATADGLYKEAEIFYTRAMETDPSNAMLYEGRSSARIQLESYEDAIEDAEKAVDLDPDFISGYFRLGVALQCIGEYSRSIASFSEGIVRDKKNDQLLNAIIEAALLSPIKATLEPVMSQLRKMRLDTNPFVILSVIGQDLLSHDHAEDAVKVLENAVTIGTKSLKLQGSVFSALSSALWSLGDTDRAIYYMNEDLSVSQNLGDESGKCRAHGNLGAAYYSKRNYQLAKEHHTKQLALAQSIQDQKAMGSAFSSLGHVHTAMSEHQRAVESHKQSASTFRSIKDPMSWSRQLGLVSSAYLSIGDLDGALQWQLECLRVTTDEFEDGSHDAAKEEAKVRVDLATVYHKMQKYTEEISCLQKSVEISKNLEDKVTEAHSLSALGYITRQIGDFEKSLQAYERMLEIGLSQGDESLEARACANLGVIHHQLRDYEMALKLQARNLQLSVEFRDVGSQGRAHGNIGNAYSAMGMYDQATQHYLKELEISTLIQDKALECSTHGNLAVAYQALKLPEKAFEHFSLQITLACQLRDLVNESRAYMNLANFHSSRKEYPLAIEKYLKYLSLAENASFEKPTGIAKACYNVAFAYFSTKDYPNSIYYYEKCLNISLDIQDAVSAARAYCNLGLSFKYNGDNTKAFECQNCFLLLSKQLGSTKGIFKALGNIGDIYMSCKQPQDAITYYRQQHDVAKENDIALLIAHSNATLGTAYRSSGEYQQSISCHVEELKIFQQLKDSKNEFRAHGHLGAVFSSLNEFGSASKCYENQCYIAQKLNDKNLQSTALGNMGITAINEQNYEKAIQFFERQLIVIKNRPEFSLERSKILCHIGDCHEALENYNDAITLFQEALDIAIKLKHDSSMEKAFCGLCSTYKLLNKPRDAFKYCKLRLDANLRIKNQELHAESYGEMGYLFTILAEFQNALLCFKKQLFYGKNDPQIRGDAACGLGSVYHILRNFKMSLTYHQLDLQIATETDNLPCQGRAHGNLGSVYESLHNHQMAVKHQEQHLFIADSQNDPFAKLTALRGIGRNVLRMGTNPQRAALLLQQALLLARELETKEDEGKVILDLALTNWVCGDAERTENQLLEAKTLLLDEFWKSLQQGGSYDMSIHPNSCVDLYKELLTCQSVLMTIYTKLNQHSEAIAAAEELRNLPEQVYMRLSKNSYLGKNDHRDVAQKLSEYSEKNDSIIFYYSVHCGVVFLWVFTPDERFCEFTCQVIDADHNNNEEEKATSHNQESNLLSQLLHELRDSMGLESPEAEQEESSSNKDIEDGSTHQEEINFDAIDDSPGAVIFQTFHRLIQAQVDMNSSRKISILGIESSSSDFPKNTNFPIYALHTLLIGKMQDKLVKYVSKQPLKQLIFVLDGELKMVPFSLMKRRPSEPYLSQQFLLRFVNSAHDLIMETPRSNFMGQFTRAVIVGHPDEDTVDGTFQASQDEIDMVSTLLKVEPFCGKNATKTAVSDAFTKAECLHFACSLSEVPPYRISLYPNTEGQPINCEPMSSTSSNTDSGLGTNFPIDNQSDASKQTSHSSLSMNDVIKMNLSRTKLVLLGSAHLQDSEKVDDNFLRSKTTKFLTTTRTFFYTGVGALVLPLWPVPETACKLLTQSFYSRLLEGKSTSVAMSESIDILRNSQQFEHPSYWAGFVLYGQDVTLDPKDVSLYHALRLLLEADSERVENIIKLSLHLIDKALERMGSRGNTSIPMYASQASIGRKVNFTNGWRQFFSAIGFELQQSSGGIPDAVIFPKANLKAELLKFKSELISWLHLSGPVLSGFSLLFSKPKIGHELMQSFWKCLEKYAIKGTIDSTQMDLILSQNVWEAEGCSALLSLLGFNVFRMGEDSVMLHCTQDCHDNVSTFFRLLNVFFEFDAEGTVSEELQNAGMVVPSQREVKSNQAVNNTLGNSMARGLLPNSRRSIAVDFNASFASQATLDVIQHLELPDHMTSKNRPSMAKSILTSDTEEPYLKQNQEVPASKPIRPSSQATHSSSYSPSKLRLHSSGSLSTNFQTIPKSPIFYRETASADTFDSKDNFPVEFKLQERRDDTKDSNLSAFSPVAVNPTHFVPILSPIEHALSVRSPGSIIHPTPKRPGVNRDVTNQDMTTKTTRSHYIPAPSFASGVLTKTFDYSNIVDKLSRLSASDLSDGQSSKSSSIQHDTPVKEVMQFSPRDGTILYNLSNDLRNSLMLGTGTQPNASHLHIRSLDSSLDSHTVTSNPHKFTLSQDGATLTNQRVERRRSSTDHEHSRTSSYTSWSSSSSHKKRSDKESPRMKKTRKATNSNLSSRTDSPIPGESPHILTKHQRFASDSPRTSDSVRAKKSTMNNRSFGCDSPRTNDPPKMKRPLIKQNSNHSFGSDSSRSSTHTNTQERMSTNSRLSGSGTLPSKFSTRKSDVESSSFDNDKNSQFMYNTLSPRHQNDQSNSVLRNMMTGTYPDWSLSNRNPTQGMHIHHRNHSLDGNSPRRKKYVDPLYSDYYSEDIPPTSPTDYRDSIMYRLKVSEASNIPENFSHPTTSKKTRRFKSKTPDPFVSRGMEDAYDHKNFLPIDNQKRNSDDQRYQRSYELSYDEVGDPLMSDQLSNSGSTRDKSKRPQTIYMKDNEDLDDISESVPEATLMAWSSAQPAQLPLEEVIKKTAQTQMQMEPTVTSTDSEVTETGTSGYNGSLSIRKTPDFDRQHVRTPIFAYSSGERTSSANPSDKHTNTSVAYV